MPADFTLCIFAKVPRPGAVKTQLAVEIGDQAAAALAQAFLEDSLALAACMPGARTVLALSGDPTTLVPLAVQTTIWSQGEGDLGERMQRVAARALESSPRAVIIGTDSPGLPEQRILAATESLLTHDAVIGPADDGGYYLLGLTRSPPGLLDALPWSSEHTRSETLHRLQGSGFSTTQLEPWFDVDVPADLRRLSKLLAGGSVQASSTERVLREMGWIP